MAQYRHVGTFTVIYDSPYKLERWGQLVEIPDALAQSCIDQGGALLPAADFDSHGVTPDELKKYSAVASHVKATAEFIAKRNALWARVAEIRAQRAAATAQEAMSALPETSDAPEAITPATEKE